MARETRKDVERVAQYVGDAIGLPVVAIHAGSSSYNRAWVVEFRKEGEGNLSAPSCTITTHYAYSARQAMRYLHATLYGVTLGRAAVLEDQR